MITTSGEIKSCHWSKNAMFFCLRRKCKKKLIVCCIFLQLIAKIFTATATFSSEENELYLLNISPLVGILQSVKKIIAKYSY